MLYGKTGSRYVGSTQLGSSVHAAYSPDLAPSDYHLFTSMSHALSKQRFGSYEDVKNGSMNSSQKNGKIVTGVVFTNYPKYEKNV